MAAAGYRLTHYRVTGSTNDEALKIAFAGDAGQHWFLADAQSAGRGRSGRPWQSEPGNLFATLLLVAPCASADLPKLGFVAGISVYEAARHFVGPEANLSLKWPNDVLVDGAKLAGILLEARTLADGRSAIAMGIGLNCVSSPDHLPYPAAHLAQFSDHASAAAVFTEITRCCQRNLEAFDRGVGFDAIRARWLKAAHGLGGTIEIRNAGIRRAGVFTGIDSSGRLLLDTVSGQITVDAADVFFPV